MALAPAQEAAPAPPPTIAPAESSSVADAASTIRPWGAIQTQTGPGVGYQTSFWTLDGYAPLLQDDRNLAFADLRGILSNTAVTSANLGGGYRYYSPAQNRIWGSNVYWDHRDTGEHAFSQVGFGFESLGRWWDARSNVYLVTGIDQKETGFLLPNPTFVQHFIQLERVGFTQAAMSGFDAEVGMPIACRWGLKAYVGTYNFQVNDSPQAWGIKTRLEERFSDRLVLDLAYSNDRVFGNNVVFSVGFRFGGGRSIAGSSRCDVYARRADRVERNEQIVVAQQTRVTHPLAGDPTTLQPIIVEHVASYAAPGGNGTFEHPFMTLQQAQSASAPGEIIYAWANSVFNKQSIALQTNQRFLGENPNSPYVLSTTQGSILLPRATDFANAPQIVGASGNAVTLASNDEVFGLAIVNSGTNGILGNGITNFNIHDNVITGSADNGISLNNVGGIGTIKANTITANGNGTNVMVTGSTATANAGDGNGSGIFISNSNFGGAIANNTIANNGDGGSATAIVVGTGASISVKANGGNGNGSGILFSATSFTGSISGNTISGNGSGGNATVSVNGNVGGGMVEANAGNGNGSGVFVNATTVNGSVTANYITGNGNGGNASASAAIATANPGKGSGISTGIQNKGTITGTTTGNTGDGTNGLDGKR